MTEPLPEVPAVDVFLSGLLFFDLVFTGLAKPPTLGAEVWTDAMGSGPGGIANFAVALRRLGLRTTLAAAFGDDMYGDSCWRALAEDEGVDLSRSRRFAGWPMPVTVSLAYGHDRALVTHGLAPPVAVDELVGQPPLSRAVAVHIGPWLQVALSQLNSAHGLDYSMVMAGALLAMTPLVVVFVLFARGFVADIAKGAFKG